MVEQRTGNAEVTGSNPVEALIFFFRLLLSNCLNWKIYYDDHSPLSKNVLSARRVEGGGGGGELTGTCLQQTGLRLFINSFAVFSSVLRRGIGARSLPSLGSSPTRLRTRGPCCP